MLNYSSNESSQSSHFFITTPQDNICILEFKHVDPETMHFDHDFLQSSVIEMVVAKAGKIDEVYCKELAETIKHIFDNLLEKKKDTIVYISIPEKSLKHQLMKRFIEADENDHFKIFVFKTEGTVFYFFLNEEKTSTFDTYIALRFYFKNEYGIEFEVDNL